MTIETPGAIIAQAYNPHTELLSAQGRVAALQAAGIEIVLSKNAGPIEITDTINRAAIEQHDLVLASLGVVLPGTKTTRYEDLAPQAPPQARENKFKEDLRRMRRDRSPLPNAVFRIADIIMRRTTIRIAS